jgi:hypothetical protein
VARLDTAVLSQVLAHLQVPGTFERLAAEQAARDAAGDSPSSQLATHQRVRKDLARRHANLLDTIGMTDDPSNRADFTHRLDELAQDIRAADRLIAAYEQLSQDAARRQAVFADLEFQQLRHMNRIIAVTQHFLANTLSEDDRLFLHHLLVSLGVQPVVRWLPDKQLDVTVHYAIGKAAGLPWFTAADADPMTAAEDQGVPPASNESCSG